MTTESRMREALEKIVSLDFASTPVNEDFERAISIAREALSPPARRTRYEWEDDGDRFRVEWRDGRWRMLVPSLHLGWQVSELDEVFAAAIATLANLSEPEEEA